MPIRPEIRRFYGPEHRAYREELIAQYGAICSECGARLEQYINLCHITHDPRRPDKVTLKCPSCHARGDSSQRFAMTRRTRARKRGQLWLLPEIEWAPYPAWEIPERVRDRVLQEKLF